MNKEVIHNVDPARCVAIEDSLSGIKSGQAAGMKVVGIATTHRPAEISLADMVIESFTELNLQKLETLYL